MFTNNSDSQGLRLSTDAPQRKDLADRNASWTRTFAGRRASLRATSMLAVRRGPKVGDECCAQKPSDSSMRRRSVSTQADLYRDRRKRQTGDDCAHPMFSLGIHAVQAPGLFKRDPETYPKCLQQTKSPSRIEVTRSRDLTCQ